MFETLLAVALVVLAAVGSYIALAHTTRKAQRLTRAGWTAVTFLLLSLVAAVAKEMIGHYERAEANAARERAEATDGPVCRSGHRDQSECASRASCL